MKTPAFRNGDIFEVVTPEIFDRVGYPLTPAIVFDEINTAENRQKTIDLLYDFGLHPFDDNGCFHIKHDKMEIVNGMLKVIAYHTVRNQGFGGYERKVYTKPKDGLLGKTFSVRGKRVVWSGIRCPGSGWSGDDTFEGPSLENKKIHRLVSFLPDHVNQPWEEVWIPVDNIKKLEHP